MWFWWLCNISKCFTFIFRQTFHFKSIKKRTYKYRNPLAIVPSFLIQHIIWSYVSLRSIHSISYWLLFLFNSSLSLSLSVFNLFGVFFSPFLVSSFYCMQFVFQPQFRVAMRCADVKQQYKNEMRISVNWIAVELYAAAESSEHAMKAINAKIHWFFVNKYAERDGTEWYWNSL